MQKILFILGLLGDFMNNECKITQKLNVCETSMQVLLALGGRMGRLIMSSWLERHGVYTHQASDWNDLTQILQELLQGGIFGRNSARRCTKVEESNAEDKRTSVFIIVIDIVLLDLSTDIWKEQLNFLDRYCKGVKFAWILNHDTSNNIKMELRRKGHLLMVNRPVYKGKMIQIMESAIRESGLELQKKFNLLRSTTVESEMHECLEMKNVHSDFESSNDSDKPEMESSNFEDAQLGEKQQKHFNAPCMSPYEAVNNCFVELTEVQLEDDKLNRNDHNLTGTSYNRSSSSCYPKRERDGENSLEGLRILLAEDTPLLQRVATIMLEKLGATVVAVGDGLQAVDALRFMLNPDEFQKESLMANANNVAKRCDCPTYDLILMDCQVNYVNLSAVVY